MASGVVVAVVGVTGAVGQTTLKILEERKFPVRELRALASARSVGKTVTFKGEPVHGTAPDIAGQGVANPIAAILSASMLLRYSLDRGQDADRLDAAVLRVLERGHRTRDVHSAGTKLVGTAEMGDLIAREVETSY